MQEGTGRLCSNNEAECGLRAAVRQTDVSDAGTRSPALKRFPLAVRQEPASKGFDGQAAGTDGLASGGEGPYQRPKHIILAKKTVKIWRTKRKTNKKGRKK